MHLSSYLIFCLFAVVLAVVRMVYTGTTDLGGLMWNLILAFLPYVFALGYVTYRGYIRWGFLFLWLFFLPNSFYILTDFVHLVRYPGMVYYDIAYITAMAFAGMVSGYASMELVHREWNIHYHRRLAWLLMIGVVTLSMVGVYIGRFLRFNSWDIWNNPLSVIHETWIVLTTNGWVWHISDPDRARVSQMFEVGAMWLVEFIVLYGGFFMMVYVYLYHAKRRN